MITGRPEYSSLRDPMGVFGDDEPIFIIRGRDTVAPEAVRAWAEIAKAYGASVQIVELARHHADDMEAYQQRRGSKMPDLPRKTS